MPGLGFAVFAVFMASALWAAAEIMAFGSARGWSTFVSLLLIFPVSGGTILIGAWAYGIIGYNGGSREEQR